MQSAIILAGGDSARFGRPKPFATLRGKPVLTWVAEALAPLADELVVSVATEDVAAKARTLLPQAAFATDSLRGRGPIEGLTRAAEAAHGELLIVAPCDAPLLQPAMYRLLLERLEDHDACVPRLGVFDPIRAVYRRGPVLEALLAAREPVPSPSALVDRLDAAFVDVEDLRTADPGLLSFFDLNRPEDRARAEEALGAAESRSVTGSGGVESTSPPDALGLPRP